MSIKIFAPQFHHLKMEGIKEHNYKMPFNEKIHNFQISWRILHKVFKMMWNFSKD